MIWIKNHGITGESDNLRIPLSEQVGSVTTHRDDPKGSPAIVVLNGWTGVLIDDDPADVRDGFETALGDQLRFAVDEPADYDDFSDKSDELDAFYDGTHPELP